MIFKMELKIVDFGSKYCNSFFIQLIFKKMAKIFGKNS
jgi:hypothetical protein